MLTATAKGDAAAWTWIDAWLPLRPQDREAVWRRNTVEFRFQTVVSDFAELVG